MGNTGPRVATSISFASNISAKLFQSHASATIALTELVSMGTGKTMSTVEALLKRLAEVEAEKQVLQSQLHLDSVRESLGSPKQRTKGANDGRRRLQTSKSKRLNNGHSPLLDLFIEHQRHVTVFDGIYRLLDIKDILAISRTCKKLSKFYHSIVPCKWDINQRLARFVIDPREFRTQLGLADALISGTFALLLFAQLDWPDSGIDIYVRRGMKADALVRYIGADKDYAFDHSYGWSDDDEQRTLKKVFIFRRRGPPASPQIRFHLTRTLPLHSILADCAFSTAHVNVISWNKAYCMFPHTTFISRRMYFLHNPDEAVGQIMSKYSAHGWRSSDWVEYDQEKGCTRPGVRENIRRIGDSSTWMIPLDLDRVKVSTTPDIVLESCTFQIYPDHGPQDSEDTIVGLKTFSIRAHTFTCCMLKHAYTFHVPDPSWNVFLRKKLSRMSRLEILKTGDAELKAQLRKADFTNSDHGLCPVLQLIPHFSRPKAWESVDYMIPGWFAEWQWIRENGMDDPTSQPLLVESKRKTKRKSDASKMPPAPTRKSDVAGKHQKAQLTNLAKQAPLTPPASSEDEPSSPVSSRRPLAGLTNAVGQKTVKPSKDERPSPASSRLPTASLTGSVRKKTVKSPASSKEEQSSSTSSRLPIASLADSAEKETVKSPASSRDEHVSPSPNQQMEKHPEEPIQQNLVTPHSNPDPENYSRPLHRSPTPEASAPKQELMGPELLATTVSLPPLQKPSKIPLVNASRPKPSSPLQSPKSPQSPHSEVSLWPKVSSIPVPKAGVRRNEAPAIRPHVQSPAKPAHPSIAQSKVQAKMPKGWKLKLLFNENAPLHPDLLTPPPDAATPTLPPPLPAFPKHIPIRHPSMDQIIPASLKGQRVEICKLWWERSQLLTPGDAIPDVPEHLNFI